MSNYRHRHWDSMARLSFEIAKALDSNSTQPELVKKAASVRAILGPTMREAAEMARALAPFANRITSMQADAVQADLDRVMAIMAYISELASNAELSAAPPWEALKSIRNVADAVLGGDRAPEESK